MNPTFDNNGYAFINRSSSRCWCRYAYLTLLQDAQDARVDRMSYRIIIIVTRHFYSALFKTTITLSALHVKQKYTKFVYTRNCKVKNRPKYV